MDPISQGIVGAAAAGFTAKFFTPAQTSAQHAAAAPRQLLRHALGLGALAGLAPDLDVFIASTTDPLLELEYHRHFTHALAFAPIGALLCAGLLYFLYARFKLNFRQTYWCCLAGFASHGLLDSCTTYGTSLFWPFADTRVAWGLIAIVDPLFTLPLVVLIIAAAWRKSSRLIAAAAVWGLLYLGFGGMQHYRAETAAHALAHSRGHTPENLTVIPAPGPLLLWKSVYLYEDLYYVDGVRTGVRARTWRGECMEKFSVVRHAPWLATTAQQYKDIARFRRFANGYIAPAKDDAEVVADIRYSLLPHRAQTMWGIRLSPDKTAAEHVDYFHKHPDGGEAWEVFVAMLRGDLPTTSPPHCALD